METIRRSRNNAFARKCLGGKDCIPASRPSVAPFAVLTKTQKKNSNLRASIKAIKAQKEAAANAALVKELVSKAINKGLAKEADRNAALVKEIVSNAIRKAIAKEAYYAAVMKELVSNAIAKAESVFNATRAPIGVESEVSTVTAVVTDAKVQSEVSDRSDDVALYVADYYKKLANEIKASICVPAQSVISVKSVLLKNLGNDVSNLVVTEANYPPLGGSVALKAGKKTATEPAFDLQNAVPNKPTGVVGLPTASSAKNGKRSAKRAAKKMAAQRSFLQVALVAPAVAASSETMSLKQGGAANKGAGSYRISSAALNVRVMSGIAAMR